MVDAALERGQDVMLELVNRRRAEARRRILRWEGFDKCGPTFLPIRWSRRAGDSLRRFESRDKGLERCEAGRAARGRCRRVLDQDDVRLEYSERDPGSGQCLAPLDRVAAARLVLRLRLGRVELDPGDEQEADDREPGHRRWDRMPPHELGPTPPEARTGP